MLLDEICTCFCLLHCLVYRGFRLLPWTPLGIVQLSVLPSLLQRLMPRPTYGLA